MFGEYRELKQQLKDDLLNSRSKVSVSFDMWSSPNFLAMMAICAYFIDSDGNRRNCLLALRRVSGSHVSYNMKQIVVEVMRENRIDTEDKVGYFMLDNAINNDLAVKLILEDLFPHWTARRIKSRRLRCLGHVVNLAAKRFLDGGSTEDALRGLQLAFESDECEGALGLLNKSSTLMQLYRLIRYIHMTPERREGFARVSVSWLWEIRPWSKFDFLLKSRKGDSLAHVMLSRTL